MDTTSSRQFTDKLEEMPSKSPLLLGITGQMLATKIQLVNKNFYIFMLINRE